MVPSPFIALVLALAAYRLTRLAGWDDFPLAVKTRRWVTGAGHAGERPARPKVAHLVACPFCIGFWISLTAYLAWVASPTAAVYLAAPLALSAAVGLIAKNLDP